MLWKCGKNIALAKFCIMHRNWSHFWRDTKVHKIFEGCILRIFSASSFLLHVICLCGYQSNMQIVHSNRIFLFCLRKTMKNGQKYSIKRVSFRTFMLSDQHVIEKIMIRERNDNFWNTVSPKPRFCRRITFNALSSTGSTATPTNIE